MTAATVRPTDLYRCWGDDGTLLYIGISLCALGRLHDHHRLQPWWPSLQRVDVTHLGEVTRAQAEAVEAQAIRDEKPRCNVVHTKAPRPPRAGFRRPNGSGALIRRDADTISARIYVNGHKHSRNVRRVLVREGKWETDAQLLARAERMIITLRQEHGQVPPPYVESCRRGHPRTPENTYLWRNRRTGKDHRYCIPCRDEHKKVAA
jgi:hypothetical protein